jgi:hypothetical protein
MNKLHIALVVLASCTTTQSAPVSTQLKITIVSPANVGDVDNRLIGSGSANPVTFNVEAFDENNQPEDGQAGHLDYNKQLGVFVHYLGTLTPYLTAAPLSTVTMTHGVAMNQQVNLPPVYGPTTIWLDDDSSADPEFVAGTSPTLWYRDPFTADLQRPSSESAIDALSNEPLNGKNVSVNGSQFGATGHLVVTSVYSQGYTIADVQCGPSGAPPCTPTDYGFMDVFSFSAPQDSRARFLSEGEVIDGYAGGDSEFDGLTELGFPQTFVNEDTPVVNTALEPPPAKFDPSWFGNPILFERNESGMIEVDNTVVCALDSDYTTFKQWKLDPSGSGDPATCAGKSIINVVSAGTLDIDPGTLVGKHLPRIVGSLRPINIGSFNVWIIYPRSMADLTTQ